MSFNDSGFSKGSLVNRVSMIGASMNDRCFSKGSLVNRGPMIGASVIAASVKGA